MVAMSEDGVRSAEMAAMAEMTKAFIGLTTEIGAMRAEFTEVKVELAVMKERQTTLARLEARLEKVEQRDHEQVGAYKGLHFLKDFGPWMLSLAVLLWGFFGRQPPTQ